MKVLSLFSGAGGLDLGIILAGNQVIWANDIDENAVATYKKNIGDHIICEDIKNIDIFSLPDAQVVVGGFPCQGFSMANRMRALEDDRNQLYRFFYNTIKIKQPLFFISQCEMYSARNGTTGHCSFCYHKKHRRHDFYLYSIAAPCQMWHHFVRYIREVV